ncbi:MAG: FkbM family methyltransferase [Gemmatimonadota bacterium]|nr:FkbM family methyltransferase [Gemmatimonadota bacterium]
MGAGDHGHWAGTFENEKLSAFSAAISEGDTVLDVGAHTGFFTLLAAGEVGPRGRVIAFEPFPRNVDYLRRHVDLNRFENVDVVHAAVGEASGEVGFSSGPNSYTGRVTGEGELTVRATTLDEHLRIVGSSGVGVLKIDVEGAEVAVLRGAESLLRQSRPIVFVAAHSPDLRQACRELLESADYVVESLERPNELMARPCMAAPARATA